MKHRKPSSAVRKISTGDPLIKRIVYHKLPTLKVPRPIIVKNIKAHHYCPNPPWRKVRHPPGTILLHRAGASDPTGLQRWRCPRCGFTRTFGGN